MSLTLLAPAALGLLGLLALPVIAHLTRQLPKEQRDFGAMLLLRRLQRRLRRRQRVKDRTLLAMRLAALAMLALAMAGPRFSYPGGVPEVGGSGRVVLVVDQSMSMSLVDQGSTLLQRARADALARLAALPDGAQVGLVSFSDRPRVWTQELTTDVERVRGQLESVGPTAGGSDLASALLEARRLLGGEPGEVLVFSDEAGPDMVAEAGEEMGRLAAQGSAMIPLSVLADPPRNVTITSAVYGDGVEGGQVTLRVTSYGPAPLEVACEVRLPDGARIPVFVDLPPLGEAEARVTVPREALGGVGEVHCDDPDLPVDDSRFFHLPRIGASRVLVVDGDPGDTPTRSEVYFLERALAPWGAARGSVTPDVVTPVGLGELDPEVHRVVFLANVADPRAAGPRLTEFVRQGGNLVIAAGDNVTESRYNAALSAVLPAPFRKVRSVADPGEEGLALALPDTSHPVFEPFRASGRTGFSRVRSHRLLTLDEYTDNADVTTLLRYEGGLPALVERRTGGGRVLVWTSTFDLGWTNFPFQSVFMPTIQRLVDWLGGDAGGGTARLEAVVGERVAVPLELVTQEPDVTGPDGELVRSRIEGSSVVFEPESPGAYAVGMPDAPVLAWVAVNLDPAESDVRVPRSLAAVEAELLPELFQRHVDLTPPLLAGALLLLLAQAWRATRRTA